MRKIIIVLFGLYFGFSSFESFSQIKNYKRGLSSMESGNFDIAIKEFLKVKDIDSSQVGVLNLKIADSYRLSNRWIEALPYYEKAVKKDVSDPDLLFNYAYALKSNEEYDMAKDYFQKFLETKPANKVLTERALRETNTLQMIGSLKEKNAGLEFKNLSELNTWGIEYSGMILDGSFVFSASKKEKTYSNGLPFLGIYKVKIKEDLSVQGTVEPFSSKILDPDRNEGSPTFTPDGKTMVFARGNSGKRKDNSSDVDLYLSRYVAGEGWTEPRLVSASDSASWDGSPAFSRDGKTLYFASDRPGGSGGLDIYRVNMDASGRFGNAANMGKAINTAGDEMFPFVSEDGKLYFASDGHPGLGKLDLFVAVRSGGKITVENLGLPYNSSMDDFGLSFDENGNQFFTSNRAAGKGSDDIYFYQAPPKPKEEEVAENGENPNNKPSGTPESENSKVVNYYLNVNVFTQIADKTVALDSSGIKVLKIEGGIEEQISEHMLTNGKSEPIKLEEDTDYVILAEKSGFLSKRAEFTMYGRSIPVPLLTKPVTDTTYITNINLEQIFIGKTFRLENIYYDLDKYDIRPDAALELDKLVQILKDNPTIKIELGSHTDIRGTDLYNIRLSQRRAEAVINYLSIKGISKERLEAKGYGETELIIQNAKDEEEHQVNRRTEFKVLEFIKATESE
ncbi:MAG: PD40 domain-containing protein [Cytophagaceae bacterium]|nr:PD40 domain-containing protein [Cytophagaceae bacterium]